MFINLDTRFLIDFMLELLKQITFLYIKISRNGTIACYEATVRQVT